MARQFKTESDALDFLHQALDSDTYAPERLDRPSPLGPEAEDDGDPIVRSVDVPADSGPKTRTISAYSDDPVETKPLSAQPAPAKPSFMDGMSRAAVSDEKAMGKDSVSNEKEPDELAARQDYANRRRRSGLLAEAGYEFAEAFKTADAKNPGGAKYWEKWASAGDEGVAQYKARRAEGQEREKKTKAAAEEKAFADPASSQSEFARSLVGKYLPGTSLEGKSAKDITTFAPWVTAIIKEQGDTLRAGMAAGGPKGMSPEQEKAWRGAMEVQFPEQVKKFKAAGIWDQQTPKTFDDAVAGVKTDYGDAVSAGGLKATSDASKKVAEDAKRMTAELRKEFLGLPSTKQFQEVSVAYDKIKAAAKVPTAAGDLSLIFAYMKVLDPGSTVREGEFANAQNATGVPGQVINAWNRALKGERLNPEQRDDFVGQAQKLYVSHENQYRRMADQYRGIAERGGAEPGDVIPAYQAPTAPKLDATNVSPGAVGETKTLSNAKTIKMKFRNGATVAVPVEDEAEALEAGGVRVK